MALRDWPGGYIVILWLASGVVAWLVLRRSWKAFGGPARSGSGELSAVGIDPGPLIVVVALAVILVGITLIWLRRARGG